jgi:hypothetical protein
MRRAFGLVVLGVGVVSGYSWLSAQSNASALQGAWQVQGVTAPQPFNPPLNKPVGLILFSGRHYAQVGVGNSVRTDLPQGGAEKATADQLRAVWGPVVADAGTFAVTGNTIKMTRVAAKGPAAMASGNFLEATFTINGDNLAITQVRNQAGPIANPTTVRLTRAK